MSDKDMNESDDGNMDCGDEGGITQAPASNGVVKINTNQQSNSSPATKFKVTGKVSPNARLIIFSFLDIRELVLVCPFLSKHD